MVTLLRTDLAQKLKEQLIDTASNISLKTTTGEKTEILGKLDASIECGPRKFHHRIYVADITDPWIFFKNLARFICFQPVYSIPSLAPYLP
ncbi:hypothetical protein AVEN_83379-1 [Araneus ventricosus]|uniref:Uncharacterized protein n=1 Tax=Araneus ventricosus TaxID=182803 RepID=A0A4Y2HJN4_ARAVE|nr:hypothetical protein AVEN_83379-1 [Araneus ventricosus]